MSVRDEAAAAILDQMSVADIAAWCGRHEYVLCTRTFIRDVAEQNNMDVTFDDAGGCKYQTREPAQAVTA